MKKKILYLIDELDSVGGAEKNFCQIIINIDKKHFIPIVACFGLLRFPELFKKNNIKPNILDIKRLYSFKGLRSIFFLYHLIKKENISLIVSYFEISDYISTVLHLITSVPFICNRRDMGYRYNTRHFYFNRIVNKFCTKIIAVSKSVASQVCSTEKVPINKIKVIYNAISNEDSEISISNNRAKSECGLNPDRIVVGILAIFRKVKRHDIFLRAACHILKNFPDIQFLIAGKDAGEEGARMSELVEYANKLSIISNVVFLTSGFDARVALKAMDISVLTSETEGFSNTLLESMILGKPVVATDVGGNKELVQHGRTGFLVPVGNFEKTANYITKLALNKETREKMGNEALRIAQQNYSLKKMVNTHECLYREVLTS